MAGTGRGQRGRRVRAHSRRARAHPGRRGRQTDVSRTAVAARVRQLVELGLVAEEAAGATTGGRPAGRLHVNRAGGVVLAASIGASKTKLGVCDLAGVVVAESGLDLDTTLGPDTCSARSPTAGPAAGQGRRAGPRRRRCVFRGRWTSASGTVVESPLLPGWGGVPIALGFPGCPCWSTTT